MASASSIREFDEGMRRLAPGEGFAAFLQTPKSSSRPLRNFRKHEKEESGVCGTSASMKKEKVVFAELPQASKSRKWCLRNFRKHQKVESGVCGTSASMKKRKVVFAELPQAFPETFWPSRGFRKESLPVLCLHRTHIKSKKCAELALFCFFCVDRKQMV